MIKEFFNRMIKRGGKQIDFGAIGLTDYTNLNQRYRKQNKKMSIIEQIFNKHHTYYKCVGVETIKQQASQYKQVSDAYQGRVIFELLQNAIDKAQSNILISVENWNGISYLLVANDGCQFTFDSAYNYENGGDNKRCDFQSLCSIATSTKNASTNIGNKGVGFKSVFSISHHATVYTKGKIMPQDDTQDINFTIRDTFNDPEELVSLNFAEASFKLKSVKKEKSSLAIPGYYFPIYKKERPKRISELFDMGYITVISIPLDDLNKELVTRRINEIQKFQFNFICEKDSFKNKDISIKFTIDNLDINLTKASKSPIVISRRISDNALQLAQKAGLQISNDSKVSVCFRTKEQIQEGHGYIYNYMPTEKMSFLSNVDLNADFQTSVDRKTIKLNNGEDEPIGQYNYALMMECLKLYRDALLDKKILSDQLFSWDHVQMASMWLEDQERKLLREVFKKSDIHFSKFVTELLRNRQTSMASSDEYIIFYQFILKSIEQFHFYNDRKDYYKGLAQKVGESIKVSGLKFLPDCQCTGKSEILFRSEESSLDLSSSIPIEITSFKIEGSEYSESLRKGLGINDFNNIYEVFKLFKQCDQNGKYNDNGFISEDEQIKIIASVGKLISMSRVDISNINSAWRFKNLTEEMLQDKKDYSTKTRAGFALSTLFYKTKNGKYKPAQLLRKDDIDLQFLSKIEKQVNNTIEINYLLLITGVSLSKYYYVDKRLYRAISEGFDFIPRLLSSKNSSYSEMIENVRIVSDNKRYPPAIVNENYSFFKNIQRTHSNNKELNSLHVGNYEDMPREYGYVLKEQLKYVCQSISKQNSYCKSELLRFYQKYFKQLYQHEIVMVKEGTEIRICGKEENYIIVSDRIILNTDGFKKPVLCYIPSKNWPEDLDEELKYRFKNVTLHIDMDQSEETDYPLSVGEKLNQKVQAQIMLKVSRSKMTDRDYEDDAEQRKRIFALFQKISIKEYHNLVGYCYLENERIKIERLPYFMDEDNLYVEVTDDDKKSKNNVAQALSFSLFSTNALSDIIELVLFSNCWIDDTAMNSILRTHDSDCYDYTFDHQEIIDNVVEKLPSDEEKNWDGVDDYDQININSGNNYNSKKDNTIKAIFDSSQKLKTAVTPRMAEIGKNGEMIVVKGIVKKFMSEYPIEQRKDAIAKINLYLQNQGFKMIELKDDQRFDTISNIAPLLWYTSQNKYAHFDVVTIEKGIVKLIEIKSTEGNNLFRLSKTEANIAIGRLDNYCLYRVQQNTHTIINYGNPFYEQLMTMTDTGLTIKASGYDVITGNR